MRGRGYRFRSLVLCRYTCTSHTSTSASTTYESFSAVIMVHSVLLLQLDRSQSTTRRSVRGIYVNKTAYLLLAAESSTEPRSPTEREVRRGSAWLSRGRLRWCGEDAAEALSCNPPRERPRKRGLAAEPSTSVPGGPNSSTKLEIATARSGSPQKGRRGSRLICVLCAVYSEYDVYFDHLRTDSIFSSQFNRGKHSRMVPGVGVGANYFRGRQLEYSRVRAVFRE